MRGHAVEYRRRGRERRRHGRPVIPVQGFHVLPDGVYRSICHGPGMSRESAREVDWTKGQPERIPEIPNRDITQNPRRFYSDLAFSEGVPSRDAHLNLMFSRGYPLSLRYPTRLPGNLSAEARRAKAEGRSQGAQGVVAGTATELSCFRRCTFDKPSPSDSPRGRTGTLSADLIATRGYVGTFWFAYSF